MKDAILVKSKVKYIQSLSQKKQRDQDGVFVAEGPKIINELLAEPATPLLELYALPEWIAQHPALDPSKVVAVAQHELERLSFQTSPQKVLGLFRKPVPRPFTLKGHITLMADDIQDPGNMGSIIRCADWFGIRQVICSRSCADTFGPKTVQSTMGSIARTGVWHEDLQAVLTAHPDILVYAATLDGRDVRDVGRLKEGIILVGNESKGIGAELLQLASEKITIPRLGSAESLNAAVAAGILFSHLAG